LRDFFNFLIFVCLLWSFSVKATYLIKPPTAIYFNNETDIFVVGTKITTG
jgi:hypothetical protein